MRRFYTIVAIVWSIVVAGCGSSSDSSSKSTKSPQTQSAGIKITKGAVKESKESEPSKENSGQFYYTYNKEKNTTTETKKRTTLDAYLNIRSPYERIRVELMIKKLSKEFIVKCSPCHDDYANGVIGPSLLDKDGEFIYKKISEFKKDKSKNILMSDLVSRIDDAELKSIAQEIAKFNEQIRKMRKERQ